MSAAAAMVRGRRLTEQPATPESRADDERDDDGADEPGRERVRIRQPRHELVAEHRGGERAGQKPEGATDHEVAETQVNGARDGIHHSEGRERHEPYRRHREHTAMTHDLAHARELAACEA